MTDPVAYRASWMLFDNATDETRPLSDMQSATTTIEGPRNLPTGSGSMIAVDVSADSDAYPAWKRPVRASFRRGGEGWKLVGLERMPENLSSDRAVNTSSR